MDEKIAADSGRQSWYFCIDLKSFYASVECVERGLNPLTARLVVADPERGEKTICLAVTPALKKLGVRSRCRLFEIPPGLSYIKATPRMRLYIKYAARIYKLYLKYFSKDDIHVYSIDEVFIDVSRYLNLYGGNVRALAGRVTADVLNSTGITAACGIGTNLYLAKIALDIEAKHAKDGIALLDESSYRRILWDHRPLTDFWRIGHGTATRLARYGIYTMRQIAAADEKLLYRVFGVDAELLIDHAWGQESVTMEDIKAYQPKTHSITSGQVLARPYSFAQARLIMKEMLSNLCLELTEKGLLASSLSLWVGYERERTAGVAYTGRGSLDGDDIASGNLVSGSFASGSLASGSLASGDGRAAASAACTDRGSSASGSLTSDSSRAAASGSVRLPFATDSYKVIAIQADQLYDRIVSSERPVRRLNISFDDLISAAGMQLDMFAELEEDGRGQDLALSQSVADIKQRFGGNALFRAMSLDECATARQRNQQIGGHRA